MRFLEPARLYLLIAVVAMAVGYVLLQRRRQRYAQRFTELALLDKVAPERPGFRRHVPAAAFLIMLGVLVVGFARPTAEVKVPRERATILVAIDVSASMEATDVAPTRFEAAQDAARRFVGQLPEQFNVGIVAFDGRARVIVPPSTDRDLVRNGIEGLDLGPATAIGEAVITALESIAGFDAQAATEPPPARIVLLSDGENTAGRSPEIAAAEAAAAGVPVYTIAYGTPDGQVVSGGYVVPVPVDGPALQRLADATGGGFYEAASGEELQAVYEDIGSSVGFRTEQQEVSVWFIGLGLLAALGAAGASLLWFSRLP
jgi:Ca-activated chloride channel family protein